MIAALLPDGERLHLQHGPIDLILGAEGERRAAFAAAAARLEGLLQSLVDELPLLRRPVGESPEGRVARRMHAAVRPYAESAFVTPMAAVAGAVADEVLAAMVRSARLDRAYVNNGGDIALHLVPGASYRVAVAGASARIAVTDRSGVRGIATSGRGGRSLSMGIADSVTVLARSAAAADAGATLIANAVDLPGHPAIRRCPARELDPDSDLGARPVVRHVGALDGGECRAALARGLARAREARARGLISGAALLLGGEIATLDLDAACLSGEAVPMDA